MTQQLSGKTQEKYGCAFPIEFSPLHIELTLYRDWTPDLPTPHTREWHLRSAMWLAYPDVYGLKGEKWIDRDDWMAWSWCHHKVSTILGHTRASKTFNAAHIAVLDYLAAPFETITTLTTVTLDALRDRLWSDAVASMKGIPGYKIVNYKYRIYPEGAPTEKFSIGGIATQTTQDAAARIQGNHAPRRRLILDEAQHAPTAIYDVLPNMMSGPDFRAFIIANPEERASDYGNWCEPEGGWNDERYVNGGDGWPTKKGFFAIRLNGLKHINILRGEKIIPHSIDREFVEMVKRTHGENSLQFYSMILGDFPPSGMVPKPFTLSVIEAGKNPVQFADGVPTIPCASLDPSHGGDEIILTFGRYGALKKDYYAVEWVEEVEIRVDHSRKDISVDRQIALEVMKQCVARKVAPADFIMDTSGIGGLVFGWLLREWSVEINSCEFGGEATERPVLEGDPRKANELYHYYVSELWHAAAQFMQHGLFGGFGKPEAAKCVEQLTARRAMASSGNRMRIEPKGSWTDGGVKQKGFKDRMGYSPDRADAAVMLVELMRKKGGIAGHVQDWKTKPAERLAEAETKHNLLDPETEFSHVEPVESWQDDSW